MRNALALALALTLATTASLAYAQDVQPAEETEETGHEPEAPIYEGWWFWASIVAVVAGITLAVVVDVTTDDPAPATAGLRIRF